MKITKQELLSISHRYIESFNSNNSSDYTNVRNNFSKLFLYKFFNNFRDSLQEIPEEIESSVIDELNFNLNRVHGGIPYNNDQDKVNGETRKSYIPPIYSLINYEFITEKIFFLIHYITTNNTKFNFLIKDEFYGYANQYVTSKEGYIEKKAYIDLWSHYQQSHKNIHKDSLRFVLTTDLKDFYDSININSLLLEFKYFVNNHISFEGLDNEINFLEKYFGFIWDGQSDFEKTFDKFLYEISRVILKANKNNNTGLPQNIIASDYLSSLYIFMKLFNNLEELKLNIVKDKEGNFFFHKKEKNNEIFFNNYSDDFTIITNDYVHGKKFLNDSLIAFFGRDGLKINSGKTNIYNYDHFLKENSLEINFNKIFNKNHDEILKYKRLLIDSLKEKNIPQCKTLIKFFYLNQSNEELNEEILKSIIKIIKIGNLRTFGKKDKDNEKGIEFFLNLVRISPKFAIQLYEVINKSNNKEYYLRVYYKFIDNFFQLLTINTLGIILLKLNYDIRNFFQPAFRSKIYSVINNKNESNFYINNLLNTESYYSKESPIIRDYRGLSNFLFKEKYSKLDIRENNIGIMLKTLFNVNDMISEKLNNKYKLPVNERPEYINELIGKLSFILEEMLKEKEKENLFYLLSPNFIADLHSLFNNLLSIIISLRKKEIVYADMGKRKNILNLDFGENKRETMFLKKNFGFSEDEINLLHFIKKKRAQYVHKERKNIEKELSLKSYNKFNNISLLESSISNILLKMFSLIDKEI